MKAGGLVLVITAFGLCFKSCAKKLSESTGAQPHTLNIIAEC
jgi:hypothetical protein